MKKHLYQSYFKNKKITIVGMDFNQSLIKDIQFLVESGALLTVTSIKTERELRKKLLKLKKYKKYINYHLGPYRKQDFKGKDIIIIADKQSSLENDFIKKIENTLTHTYSPLSLFFEILKKENIPITHIGIAGSKGKSTTIMLVQKLFEKQEKNIHLIKNTGENFHLALLKKIKEGDIILSELDSWSLQWFHRIKQSPHIALLTNFFENHLDYYPSLKKYFLNTSAIYTYQKENDILIYTSGAKTAIQKLEKKNISSKKILASFGKELKKHHFFLFGKHNEQNIALTFQLGKIFKINEKTILSTLTKAKALKGRFQYVTTVNKIHFYNDNSSNTPESTLLSLQSIKREYPDRNIIWIGGGSDKKVHYEKLVKYLERELSFSILLAGTATQKIKSLFQKKDQFIEVMSMKTAVHIAFEKARAGDVIILSPASDTHIFKNEEEQNLHYLRAIKKLERTYEK